MAAALSLTRILRVLRHLGAGGGWHHLHHLRLELLCHLEERRLIHSFGQLLTVMVVTWRGGGGRAGAHLSQERDWSQPVIMHKGDGDVRCVAYDIPTTLQEIKHYYEFSSLPQIAHIHK